MPRSTPTNPLLGLAGGTWATRSLRKETTFHRGELDQFLRSGDSAVAPDSAGRPEPAHPSNGRGLSKSIPSRPSPPHRRGSAKTNTAHQTAAQRRCKSRIGLSKIGLSPLRAGRPIIASVDICVERCVGLCHLADHAYCRFRRQLKPPLELGIASLLRGVFAGAPDRTCIAARPTDDAASLHVTERGCQCVYLIQLVGNNLQFDHLLHAPDHKLPAPTYRARRPERAQMAAHAQIAGIRGGEEGPRR